MNALTHREQHRIAASLLDGFVEHEDRRPTGDEYRQMRRVTASRRRYEQRQARIAAGTDRATLRARRTAAP